MTIDRRTFLKGSSLALLAAAYPRWAHAMQKAGGKFIELSGGIGIFTEQGGTIGYLINDHGVVFVDSQFEQSAKHCLEAIQKRTDKPLECLINTHHHADHTSGNGVFKPAVKKIVAQERVPELQRQQAKARRSGEPVVPDTLFKESWKMQLGDEVITAKYYGPAHTGGDAVITFRKANIAHIGDLVFNGLHPFIDPPGGASIVHWPIVLDATLKDHDKKTKYIFGHAGPGFEVVGTKRDVEAFRDYLNAVVEHVAKGLKAGQSKDEITSLAALPKFEKLTGIGKMTSLKRSLEIAWDELSKKS